MGWAARLNRSAEKAAAHGFTKPKPAGRRNANLQQVLQRVRVAQLLKPSRSQTVATQ